MLLLAGSVTQLLSSCHYLNMPDPFSTLPLPLPLMILESIEDLSTLNYLLQSSSAANVIFERYYCEIAEAVLSNFAPQLQRLLRTIVFIRSNRLSICRELISSEALDSFLGARVLNDNAGSEPLSNAKISLVAVRSVTKSAGHVQQITASFFEEFQDRLNSIKPYYFQDNSYYIRHGQPCLSEEEYRANLPEGCRYDIIKRGVPSWIEEQRVCRALWHLQLYFDLTMITKPCLGASSLVWDLLTNLGPHRVWSKPKRPWAIGGDWELREMDCVYGFLCEFSGETTLPLAHRSHLSELPATEPDSVTVPKSIPYHDHTMSKETHPTTQLGRPSPGVSTTRRIQLAFNPSLQYSRFDPLWRLGFHIWDRERMAGLGLITVPRSEKHLTPVKNGFTKYELCFRWDSLIAEEWKNDTGHQSNSSSAQKPVF